MQPIASLRPGQRAAVMGEIKSTQLAVTRRRGFKIFHAIVGDASGAIRCSWMNQAYLADVLAAARDGGDLRRRQARLQRPALPEPGVRAGERRPGGAERRPHRAVLRAHRHRDAEHAAAAGAAGARRSAAAAARICCPTDLRARRGLVDRRPALEGAHFPAGERAGRGSERVPLAGAAPADLRGVLPLPARPRLAAPCGRRRGQAASHHGGRPRAEVGGGGAAVHADARASARRSRRSSTTCRRPRRCTGCCRATSAPARPSSRCWPRWWRWRTASRWRCWRRPRSWPSSTTPRWRSCWRRPGSASTC